MNAKLNNKGFTLVELLAVLIILVSVSFVAVGGITESLTRRDAKECDEQKDLAISAAKMYFSLDGKGRTNVTIQELKNKGYIKSYDNKISLLEDGHTIKITSSGYSYVGNCKQ